MKKQDKRTIKNRELRSALRELYSHLWRCKNVYTKDNDGFLIDYGMHRTFSRLAELGYAEKRVTFPDKGLPEIAFRILPSGIQEIGEDPGLP